MRRKKSKTAKKKCQIRHARRRLLSRFGIALSIRQLAELSQYIQRQHNEPAFREKAVFFDRESNRITRWFIWFEGVWLPVAYDSIRKTIVTVLPAGSFTPIPPPPDQVSDNPVLALVGKHVLFYMWNEDRTSVRQFNGFVFKRHGIQRTCIRITDVVEIFNETMTTKECSSIILDTTDPSFISIKEI